MSQVRYSDPQRLAQRAKIHLLRDEESMPAGSTRALDSVQSILGALLYIAPSLDKPSRWLLASSLSVPFHANQDP